MFIFLNENARRNFKRIPKHAWNSRAKRRFENCGGKSFKNGVKAALLAPTAINQQKFSFELKGDEVIAKPGIGFYTKVDLGIAEYHFELGAGKKVFNI